MNCPPRRPSLDVCWVLQRGRPSGVLLSPVQRGENVNEMAYGAYPARSIVGAGAVWGRVGTLVVARPG